MDLLVSREHTETGVDIYQDGEILRAATPCCGFVWQDRGFEFTCGCEKITVKTFLHSQYIHMTPANYTTVYGWVHYWTGLLDAVTKVEW